jgi:hypothetical protein
LTYETITGGALAEMVNSKIQEILLNVQDVNTPWKTKRELTIKLKISPNEDRDQAAVDIDVSTKLASLKGIETDIFITRIRDNVVAFEREDPRQMSLFPPEPTAAEQEPSKPNLSVVGSR